MCTLSRWCYRTSSLPHQQSYRSTLKSKILKIRMLKIKNMYECIFISYLLSILSETGWLSIAPWKAMAWVLGQNRRCEWWALKDGHNGDGQSDEGEEQQEIKSKGRVSERGPSASCSHLSRGLCVCPLWTPQSLYLLKDGLLGGKGSLRLWFTQKGGRNASIQLFIQNACIEDPLWAEHRERCGEGRQELESARLLLTVGACNQVLSKATGRATLDRCESPIYVMEVWVPQECFRGDPWGTSLELRPTYYPRRKRNVIIFIHIFTVSSSGMQLPMQQKCVIIIAINIELVLNVKCRLIKKKDHKAVKLSLPQKTEMKVISPTRYLSWRRQGL